MNNLDSHLRRAPKLEDEAKLLEISKRRLWEAVARMAMPDRRLELANIRDKPWSGPLPLGVVLAIDRRTPRIGLWLSLRFWLVV